MNRISAEPACSCPTLPRAFSDAAFFSDDPAAVIHAPGRAEALEEARRFHLLLTIVTDLVAAIPTVTVAWRG
jgi:hypothetical protein